MDMRVETQTDDVAVVRPIGRLDLLSAPDSKKQLSTLVGDGHRRLVVDLGGVVFVDSSGLGALIAGIRDARLAEGDLVLARPNDQARVILELTTLDQILRTFRTPEDAVEGLGA